MRKISRNCRFGIPTVFDVFVFVVFFVFRWQEKDGKVDIFDVFPKVDANSLFVEDVWVRCLVFFVSLVQCLVVFSRWLHVLLQRLLFWLYECLKFCDHCSWAQDYHLVTLGRSLYKQLKEQAGSAKFAVVFEVMLKLFRKQLLSSFRMLRVDVFCCLLERILFHKGANMGRWLCQFPRKW